MPNTTHRSDALSPSIAGPHGLPPHALRVLRLLFELGQADAPAHVGTLASHLGQPVQAVAEHLLLLELAGLARADRARLTMAGLVVATRLPSVARDTPASGALPGSGLRRRARAPRQLPVGFIAVR